MHAAAIPSQGALTHGGGGGGGGGGGVGAVGGRAENLRAVEAGETDTMLTFEVRVPGLGKGKRVKVFECWLGELEWGVAGLV